MTVGQTFQMTGTAFPALTHQRIQELKQTPKGQLIMNEAFAAFPELVKSMTSSLQEGLSRYEETRKREGRSPDQQQTLAALIEDYQFLEFAQHIMFIKWREEKKRFLPGSYQAN